MFDVDRKGFWQLAISFLHLPVVSWPDWCAADLCEQAAALLKTHATDFSAVSPELRKFIALSSSLYEARAKVSLAKQEQQAENMGLCLSNLKAIPP